MSLVRISRALSKKVGALSFAEPVAYVYNPLAYARRSHELYLERFGGGPKEAVFLGMNPGPWGMAQTGVPFGDVGFVRDFLGIEAKVDKPEHEHPKRQILGFQSPRSEVSGSRLWGWAQTRFGSAEAFHERFFVLNYCPLVFMEAGGKNRVPEKLPKDERAPLEAACDHALRKVIAELKPKRVIGVGKWAQKRAVAVLSDLDVEIGSILHPSPASPIANRGWAPQAEAELEAMGVALP